MSRTSLTHPLNVATIDLPFVVGKLGLTFCPGKVQSDALTGSWDRDLNLDMDRILDWGAAIVVTLIENHEIQSLRVSGIRAACEVRGLDWVHLPIADYSIPERNFEERWPAIAQQIVSCLHAGTNALVHCKGGLGRAGLVAARICIEMGSEQAEAVQRVRERRPGAIETSEQEANVLAYQALTKGPANE